MSSLRKQALANSGSLRPLYEDETQESSTGNGDAMAPPDLHRQLRIPPRLRNLTPLAWQETDSFTEQVKIASKHCKGLSFNVWIHRAPQETANSQTATKPLYYCFAHGAGSSGISFAHLVKQLRSLYDRSQPIGIISMDYRGHGETTSVAGKGQALHFSLDTLCQDFVECTAATLDLLCKDEGYEIILVGHSLGGAIVTSVAHDKLLRNICAFVVLDVVEGTALDALHSTSQILSQRPVRFSDWSEAIGWALSSKTVSNQTSARISIPALLQEADGGTGLVWRHDWHLTQSQWQAWFEKLSSKFLEASRSLGKLLILAGTDRLDRPLMIAQMQGAFQMNVIPGAGHFVHEDEPAKVAQILMLFAERYNKGGDLL